MCGRLAHVVFFDDLCTGLGSRGLKRSWERKTWFDSVRTVKFFPKKSVCAMSYTTSEKKVDGFDRFWRRKGART